MTEKNLSIAAPRCAFNVWKYVHWGNAHRTNHQTNQPTLQRPVYGGSRLRKFHPFPSTVDSTLPVTTLLFVPRPLPAFASLPTSSPALLSASPSPFTDGDSVCVYRRQSLPRPRVFSRFFSPRVYPTPETTPDGGGGGGRRPEGAAVGIETQPRQFSYRTT